MSIVYELKDHIDLWLVGILSIFIAFFLIVNEVIKVKSIKNVHNGNNKALLSFIFTFVISIALSGTGIYLWVNKTQDINSKSLIDKTVKVNDIKSEYTKEFERLNLKSFEDTKEFLNLKKSLTYWENRSAATLDERTEIRNTIREIQNNINENRKAFNRAKKELINKKENELESKLKVVDVEFNNQSKEVNKNNLLTYILLTLVIIVEFAIIYLNNNIAKGEQEILNLKDNDEVNKYLIGRKILKSLYLTADCDENNELFTTIKKAQYLANKMSNLEWEDFAELYNLYIDLGILDNGSTMKPKDENKKGILMNRIIMQDKKMALKKYDEFYNIVLSNTVELGLKNGRYFSTICNHETGLNYLPLNLKYHKDWNWLMPVVEKIETLKYVDEFNIQYDSVAKGHIVSITPAYDNTFNAIYTDVYENKIDAVYHAVIKFIEWYNQQK